MLDGEMKWLNATGNYIDKKQAQPITPDQENYLWELGLLGEHNAQVLLNIMVYLAVFFLHWGVEMNMDDLGIHPLKSSLMNHQVNAHI